jgi:hypothetical protein
MATVMEQRAGTPVGRARREAAKASRLPITLADLITVLQDVVGPEDDGLVVATVQHLLGSVRLMERGIGTRQCPPRVGSRGGMHGELA